MERHFTASVYIFHEAKTLLLFHKKLQKWLPPGGHVETNETPSEAAIREAFEETGIEVELIMQENILIDQANATSIPRPYLCLLENIPAWGTVPSHQHIDFVYVARPSFQNSAFNQKEEQILKWFDLDEIRNLKVDQEMYLETFQTLEHLFAQEFNFYDLKSAVMEK